MNIVVVTEHFDSGGLETHLLGFIRCLHASGNRVSLVTGANARIAPLRDLLGARILQLEIPRPANGGTTLDLARRIARFCRDQDCDILHVHPFATLLLGGLAAAEAKLPFVVTLHGPRNMSLDGGDIVLQILSRTVLATATRVFSVSADLIPEVQLFQPRARCSPLPNGVNTGASRAATRRAGGDWAIVTRLDKYKSIAARHAIEALGNLPEKNYRIDVYGDGPSRVELESWVAAQSYASRVSFKGFCESLSERLEQGYAGAAGMARSFLDVGVLGLPVLLAGYDGIKGLVRSDQLSALRSGNYTGRRLPTITPSEFQAQMANLETHPNDYSLRSWIIANADEERIWKTYIAEIGDSTLVDYSAWSPLVRALEEHPERPVFCEETLIPLVSPDEARLLRMRIAKREMKSLLRTIRRALLP